MKSKKAFGIILILWGIGFAIARGGFRWYVKQTYHTSIDSDWTLADRASTISQKTEYIDKFVSTLENLHLSGIHDALFFPNNANDFDQNLKALKSLQKRLRDLRAMDENSMAYQTAMQQITAQEQGEANNMLQIFYFCWLKENYYTLWNDWILILFVAIQAGAIIVGWLIYENNKPF